MNQVEMLARLRANAEVIGAQVADVGEEQARWKPAPDQWSILEVMSHLADEEVEDFRTRLDLTLHRPEAPWSPIDPPGWAVERRYNQGSLPEATARFQRERQESLRWLEALEEPDWSLAHEHPTLGTLTAGDLLTAWAGHDLIHIRQLNRLHRQYLVEVVSEHDPSYAGRW